MVQIIDSSCHGPQKRAIQENVERISTQTRACWMALSCRAMTKGGWIKGLWCNRVSHFRIACLAFGLIAMFQPANAAQVERGLNIPASAIVGNWYGVGEPDDPSISYIDAYAADGTFHSEFRKCVRNEVVWRQTETGKWSVRDGVLRMISITIDGKPDVFDNSYTIECSAPNEFRARLHDVSFLFIEKRIDKFEFPPCYVGS